jgi:predicted FMN-binding regulatory protein PaiB
MSVSAYFDFDKSDPLWDKTPAVGMEGLVNTIDDQKQLVKELVKLNKDTKKKMRPPPRSRAPIQTDTWFYG